MMRLTLFSTVLGASHAMRMIGARHAMRMTSIRMLSSSIDTVNVLVPIADDSEEIETACITDSV